MRELDTWAERLTAGEVPVELQVDVFDALRASSPKREQLRQKFEGTLPADPVGRFAVSLTGGDADAGQEIFFNHAAAQCVRCHTAGGSGGTAGPDLTGGDAHPGEDPGPPARIAGEPEREDRPRLRHGHPHPVDGRTVAGTLMTEERDARGEDAGGEEGDGAEDDIERRPPAVAVPAVDRTLTTREIRT